MIHQSKVLEVNLTQNSIISLSPIEITIPERPVKLQLRISATIQGENLPVILFSHGHGMSNYLSSLNGNLPLTNYWAEQGFIVIQPTHLDSKTLKLGENITGWPLFWRSRAEDMIHILNQLKRIESIIPEIKNRVDYDKIVAAGLSMGAHTTSLLLGAEYDDPEDGNSVISLRDNRIKAGILFSSVGNGNGGKDLSKIANENYPFLKNSNFTTMKTNTLVIAGDNDISTYLSIREADWATDPYFLSPRPKALVTVFGGEHLLGGLSGYDAAETTDENPERVSFIQKLTTAYLKSQLYHKNRDWEHIKTELSLTENPLGKIETK
ncbi:alpha/beta hydrolase family protein [Hyunsoonleella pacifica]|uniref:Chlorophyllase n=1 Tax=Hyunsoonleella pacifica TaxID=1080224 RepID=A0A4Q9FMJ0_9FLAO|nr:chlorophyllase [Hyunsoonleella pacifica]TBN13020.1 chlorophyllase [Hyunsoonleella pacifica]GGD27826.1 hypothetical protein GCM10011368_32280 [Hyunsoonleella pacifica]